MAPESIVSAHILAAAEENFPSQTPENALFALETKIYRPARVERDERARAISAPVCERCSGEAETALCLYFLM